MSDADNAGHFADNLPGDLFEDFNGRSRVDIAARASMRSQQRTSICWLRSRLPSRMPVTRFREGSPYTGRQSNLN